MPSHSYSFSYEGIIHIFPHFNKSEGDDILHFQSFFSGSQVNISPVFDASFTDEYYGNLNKLYDNFEDTNYLKRAKILLSRGLAPVQKQLFLSFRTCFGIP